MSSQRLGIELEKAAYDFDFFEVLRLIESWHPDKPRLGTGVKATDDPVRLTQLPELKFPVASIAEYNCADDESGYPHLAVNFMGLFGPHGPLPLHLTEYAWERSRHHHDHTFTSFANIFHHRMLCLFYRAWANSRPAVSFDRPSEDRFSFYIGSFLGIAGPAFRERDALADRAKLFYAAYFSQQCKNPDGLSSIIYGMLNINVQIKEFVGEWMSIQLADQTRLGWSPELATLGQSALIGASVWGCQHKFRVMLGPMKLLQYLALLPSGAGLAQLVAIIRNYAGDEFVWDTQLILKKSEIPQEITLGKSAVCYENSLNGEAQLGWSMWLGPRGSEMDADDLRLNPFIKMGVV